jgi:hypothetical protein
MTPVNGKGRSGDPYRSRLVLALVVALATAGCSQVAAVAPVGGTREAEVRFAGNDVLVEQGVAILTAPVCASESGTVTCTGAAVDGTVITVSAASGGPMRVQVGDRTLYDGPVQTVLEKAGRP